MPLEKAPTPRSNSGGQWTDKENPVERLNESIAAPTDTERARRAKARMTPEEREAFDRLLGAFPGSRIGDFIPAERNR